MQQSWDAGTQSGGDEPGDAKAHIISYGLQLKLESDSSSISSFSYALLPGVQLSFPVDWQYFVREEGVTESNICFYELVEEDQLGYLLHLYDRRYTKAVVLVNTKDHYDLPGGFVSSAQEIPFPVLIVKKRDGEEILRLLETEKERIFARAHAENQVDLPRNMTLTESSGTGQGPGLIGWVTQKVTSSDWARNVQELMLWPDNVAISDDRGRFIQLLCLFHNCKKIGKKDISDVMKKLNCHVTDKYKSNFPFYILLVHCLQTGKHCDYDDVRKFTVTCLNKFEHDMTPKDIQESIMPFINRGDFPLAFNPPHPPEESVFSLFEKACFKLASVSYDIRRVDGWTSHCIYKNFLYSGILWISLGLKFRDARKLPLSYMYLVEWEHITDRHSFIKFDRETIAELKSALEVECLLELPSALAYNYQYLKTLLVAVRPFGQLRLCLIEIENYITSSDDLSCVLLLVREQYDGFIKSPETLMFKLAHLTTGGTLKKCLQEGIEFVDGIHHIISKRNLEEKFLHSEIHNWLKMLLQMVPITSGSPTVQLIPFINGEEPVIKKYRSITENLIIRITEKNFEELSIVQFLDIYKCFFFWPSEYVCNFLEVYKNKIPDEIQLSDPTWNDFFTQVVKRNRNAKHHQYLEDFLYCIGTKYQETRRSEKFIGDLLKLDVKSLLSMEYEEDQDSLRVRKNFSKRLSEYIKNNHLKHFLIERMTDIMDLISGEMNGFQYFVMKILYFDLMPELTNARNDGHFKALLRKSVESLKNDLTWLNTFSAKQWFCWNILSICCSKITVSKDNFDWVQHYFISEDLNLGLVYNSYCTCNLLPSNRRHITALPPEIQTHPSRDVLHRYFEFIAAIQKVLIFWNEKFQNFDVNYSTVLLVDSTLIPLGGTVCASSLLSDVGYTKEKFNFLMCHLNHFLLLCDSESPLTKWFSVQAFLEEYGVHLPQTARELISKVVSFPGERGKMSTDFLLPSNPDRLMPNPEISLKIHKHTTYSELKFLVDCLNAFLENLFQFTPMLTFFKLNKSLLFDKYLRHSFKIMQDTLSGKVSTSFVQPSWSVVLASDLAHNIRMHSLLSALESTHVLIVKIISGAATYSEITAEDELLRVLDTRKVEMSQQLDIQREFTILSHFSGDTGTLSKELHGMKNMLELVQYAYHIDDIQSVCDQFHLEKCTKDPLFVELINIAENVRDKKLDMTPKIATDCMERVRKMLHLNEKMSSDWLYIFAAASESATFYQFVIDKQFDGPQGQANFLQQYQLIVAQLQHEEYDQQVLNHLRAAFQAINPFIDVSKTFTELIKEVSTLNAVNSLKQLKIVNANIALIQLWFSRAEGDTLENVGHELDCIIETGCYTLLGGEKYGDGGHMFLTYVFHAQPTVPKQVSKKETNQGRVHKNSEQIRDFVRKLGFLDKDQKGGDRVKNFLHLSQIVSKLSELYLKLRELGHPDYLSDDKIHTIRCSISKEDMNSMVNNTICQIADWKDEIDRLCAQYTWLLYFSVPKMLSLYRLICSNLRAEDREKVEEIVHEVSFLVTNTQSERNKLRQRVKKALEEFPNVSTSTARAMLTAGEFLNIVFEDHNLPQRCLIKNTLSHSSHAAGYFAQPLYPCSVHSQQHVICLVLGIFSDIPESYRVLQCNKSTTEEELKRFLKRVEKHRGHYLVLDVNRLPFKLQEDLVQAHLSMSMLIAESPMEDTPSVIHFIETAPSMLHKMPSILLKDSKDCSLAVNEAKSICRQHIKSHGFLCIQMVYGIPGDGKTHYIKKKLDECPHTAVIAVNEAFSPLSAIKKLRSLPLNTRNIGIFFNFTILPPGDLATESEQTRYGDLMEVIGWFFFNLLLLNYVEDPNSGLSFFLPGGLEWAIYIEVPCRNRRSFEESLELLNFYEAVPILELVSYPHYIYSDTPFDVDKDVQLVCKYLQAYDGCDRYSDGSVRKRINRLFSDPKNRKVEDKDLIKFSTNPDLSDEVCLHLLHKYMPAHLGGTKITQQLFVRYMKRRCSFLDKLPAFNYNYGTGEVQKNKETGKKKVTDTTQLGSILMETMLKEVGDFCDPNLKENWSHKSHQQLIYDFKDGGASLGLISLHPNFLTDVERDKFSEIGIDIPTTMDFYSREVLDQYLSRALDVDLEDGQLTAIDDSAYVLTLDYAIKMLDIHERFKCGVPVIIEGETGVGKTALVEMLSRLWNQSLLLEWRKQRSRLLEFIESNLRASGSNEYKDCLQEMKSGEVSLGSLLLLFDHSEMRDRFYSQLNKYLCPMRNDPVVLLLVCKAAPKKPLNDLFDATVREDTPETTASLLHAILHAEVEPIFHKINVHAAMTPADVKKEFKPVITQARQLQDAYQQMKLERREEASSSDDVSYNTPFVNVFLDEVNTSSCLGLFKEIIVDKSLDGEPLPANVFIVAACNPHRGNSLASHESTNIDWVRSTYYVHALHPTIKLLMWNYGSLDEHQERDYISVKMNMISRQVSSSEVTTLTTLIVQSQEKMREFAFRQLKDQHSSRSCVSQRDIQRVFTFYSWLKNMYKKLKPHGEEDYHRRALMVALGLVYYMRLNAEFRKEYREYLDGVSKRRKDISFSDAFREELDYYINQVELPKGIAPTTALKENLFATIICTATHTPLIIAGAPGSSKTLSCNQTIANLRGQESKKKLFRNTEFFHSLDPHYYQCSRRTTSKEIEMVFSRAIKSQRSHCDFNLSIYCVVFMDEAGLPEESHESLKVLHYHLDKQEVSFVAITNHMLDAAKTNRAVSLYRPEASDEDLETLAKGCLCSNREDPPVELQPDLNMVVKLCKPYLDCMKDPSFSRFFGLRDFIHFVNYLCRKRNESNPLSQKLVVEALERNFNWFEGFDDVCKAFLKVFGSEGILPHQRHITEVLEDSMKDHPQAMQGFENEVRYKLLVDPSGDDSLVRLLFSFGVLERKNTHIFMCSNFPENEQIQKINTIAAIRHSAIEGHTVVLSQTDDIHESFYDLFNQRFRRIDDPKHGPRYYANIAIGSHSKPSRVDPKFQCVVVIKKSEVETTPAPFLNRFEKYLISHGSMLEAILNHLPPHMASMVRAAREKVEKFISVFNGSDSFYGFQPETLDSLVLDLLPCMRDEYATLDENRVVDSKEEVSVYLFQEVLNALRHNAKFNIPKSSETEQLKKDAAHMHKLLAHDPKFEDLQNMSCHEVMQAVTEAFNGLHQSPSHVRARLTPSGCMVVSLLQQVLVRLLITKLMNIMTTEAVIIHRSKIPPYYLENYFGSQAHFNLREVISNYHTSVINDPCRSPNKLILFTRSSSLVYTLPSPFSPHSSTTTVQQTPKKIAATNYKATKIVADYVFKETDKLIMHKLSNLLSQSSVEELLKDFVSSDTAEVCVLLANMQETERKTLNHVRVMIEEAELAPAQRCKMFVLLLHFPPNQFFQHCYPSLFLKGWDHCYLDSLAHSTVEGVVDIQDWFFKCYFPVEKSSPRGQGKDTLLQTLTELLPQAILIMSARVTFGNKKDVSFNSSMSASQRIKALQILLFDRGVGIVLCKKFQAYWDPEVMAEYLERATTFSKQRESTLSITDTIQSQFKALFMDFCVYMLAKANENFNLDIIYTENSVSPTHKLFLDIFMTLEVPKLQYLNVLSNNLPRLQPLVQKPHFPFFIYVYQQMEKQVELSEESTNLEMDLLSNYHLGKGRRPPGDGPAVKLQVLVEAVLTDLGPKLQEHPKPLISLAIGAMASHQNIWKSYFADFITHKLKLVDSAIHTLQQDTDLNNLHLQEMPQRLVQLHCHTSIHQIHFAQMAATLRLLNEMEGVQQFQSSSFTSTQILMNTHPFGSPTHLSSFVINTLFNVLAAAVLHTQESLIHDKLRIWFKSFCDAMFLPTLKQCIYCSLPESSILLKAMMNVMQATFASLQSTLDLDEDTLFKGQAIFTTLFSRYFKKTMAVSIYTSSHLCYELKTANYPGLEQVLVEALEVVSSSSFTPTLHCWDSQAKLVTEWLLAYFFSPDWPSYSHEDVQWFLEFANQQEQWNYHGENSMMVPDQQEPSTVGMEDHPMKMNLFKYYLGHILGNYEEEKSQRELEKSQKLCPMSLHRQQFRNLIGEILMQPVDLGSPGPYIPFFYLMDTTRQLGENRRMQQPLCHLYFATLMEHLSSEQLNPSDLVQLIKDVQEELHRAKGEEGKLLRAKEGADGLLRTNGEEGELLRAEGDELLAKEGEDEQLRGKRKEGELHKEELLRDKEGEEVQEELLMAKRRESNSILLYLEVQALVQVFILKLASHFNPVETHKIGDVYLMVDDINNVLENPDIGATSAHRHGMVLAMHLIKLLKSSRRFVDLITKEVDDLKCITCLGSVRQKLKEGVAKKKVLSKPLLLSFLPEAVGELNSLYECVVSSIVEIDKRNRESRDLLEIAYLCGEVSTFKMVLLLAIYHEFYDKKRISQVLQKVIGENKMLEHLQDEGCIHLIRFFLDPNLQVSDSCMDELNWLFVPDPQKKLDQSELDLRHALVSLVAVILGSPPCSNHLWYHLFAPQDLENSYVTPSFMYDSTVHCDGLMYDCGVELTDDGEFSRPDYRKHACRGTYTLHSLYLLLWANFGSFCMALLTQPDAKERIHGHIISEKLPLRHYCVTQLKFLWSHIQTNLGLSEEQRSFFIMTAITKLHQVISVPAPQEPVFKTLGELSKYEIMWHTEIYKPAMDVSASKLLEFPNQRWEIMNEIRDLDIHYPHFPVEEDFTHYLNSLSPDLDQHAERGRLRLLLRFAREWECLQVGGSLLPSLIEFYQWLHTDISCLATYKEASSMSIGEVITSVLTNLDKGSGGHIRKLYEKVKREYNCYVELRRRGEGSAFDQKCAISDDKPILHLLTDVEEERQGNDWLYLVIADIITNHNSMIENFYTTIHARKSSLYCLLPGKPAKISLVEVTSTSAILSNMSKLHGINGFLQLIRSCHQPPTDVSHSQQPFQLDRLEEDLVFTFIAGKPVIEAPSQIRKVFKFRVDKTQRILGLTQVDLQTLNNQLPEDFKLPIPVHLLKRFEYEFHSADHNIMSEIVTALRTIIEFLIKTLDEKKGEGENFDDLKSEKVLTLQFMQNLHENDNILHEIGVRSVSPPRLRCLSDLPLTATYCCLSLFFHWVENGFYDFRAIPFLFKMHLNKHEELALTELPRKWVSTMSQLAEKLEQLIHGLKHHEHDIINEASNMSILDYLIGHQVLQKDDVIAHLIPRTIVNNQYVELRLALQKLQLKIRLQLEKGRGQKTETWSEIVADLWESHLPHMRDELHRGVPYSKTGDFSFQKLDDDDSTIKLEEEREKEKEEEKERLADSEFQPFAVSHFPDMNQATYKDTEEGVKGKEKDGEEKKEESEVPKIPNQKSDTERAYEMTSDDIAAFLARIGLPQYREKFEDEDVDGDMLLDLVKKKKTDSFSQLGVDSPLHLMKIMQLFLRELQGTKAKYSNDHLTQFLCTQRKIDQYATTLKDQGIDGDMILYVEDDLMEKVLKEIGISELHASSICRKYKKFCE